MTTKHLITPLIAGALILAGCEMEQTETANGAVDDTTAVDTVEGSPGPDGDDAILPNPGELSPINRSDIRGSAQVERADDELQVTVEAEGLEADGDYAVHVHEGRCTEAGPVVLDAGVMTGGEAGSGSLEFRGGSADVLDEGDVSVQLTGPVGEAVACADVEPDSE